MQYDCVYIISKLILALSASIRVPIFKYILYNINRLLYILIKRNIGFKNICHVLKLEIGFNTRSRVLKPNVGIKNIGHVLKHETRI